MKSALRILVDRPDSPGAGSTHSSGRTDEIPNFYPSTKAKLDQLFLQWLSQPESQALVNTLIEEARAGNPIKGPTQPASNGPAILSPSTSSAIFCSTPPLSPHKSRSPRSPLSPARKSLSSNLRKPGSFSIVPQFYFPLGAPIPEDLKHVALARIDAAFSGFPSGLPQDRFLDVVKQVCELPRILGYPLFEKLADKGGTVRRDAFVHFWISNGLVSAAPVKRLFEVLRTGSKQFLVHDDFRPLMAAVVAKHPGLEFLKEAPEFQGRYADTVIYRIFYKLNKAGNGQLTLRDLRRGDLLEVLHQLDNEDDINKILRYFSYEHFYVVYCKFWELDQDHDMLIDMKDLLKYSCCSLTFRIVDRIFSQVPRRFTSNVPGKMGYEDFVWFILSEEDKTTDTALQYWFSCVDIDSDGFIRPHEMLYFYEEQAKRMEGLSAEVVLFEDVLCQLHDMLQPADEGAYTLRDLKRVRNQGGLLFNILFNLNKFMMFENRDPFANRHHGAGDENELTDWDRFARIEYLRLAMDEEADDMQVDGADNMWAAHMDAT